MTSPATTRTYAPGAGSVGRVLAITSLSLREALHSRTMIVAIILNVLYLGFLALLGFAFANSGGIDELPFLASGDIPTRIFLSIALGGASGLALFIGVFSSVGSIANEIERGTILAVVARPVDRWEIVLGKFLGHGLLALVFLFVDSLIIALVTSVFTGHFIPDLLPYLALLGLNVLIMIAVSLAGSTRFSTVANAVIVIVLYIALTNTGIIYLIGFLINADNVQFIADASRFLLPIPLVSQLADDVLIGPAAAFLGGAGGAGGVLGDDATLPLREWAWLYGLGYLAFMLLLATVSLRRRDLR
jgi:ABC-type transport system involved in multi-copper enzyme maturation permease subunit